jgi:hypothetical protein
MAETSKEHSGVDAKVVSASSNCPLRGACIWAAVLCGDVRGG